MDAIRPQPRVPIRPLRDGLRPGERDPLQRQLGRRPLGTEALAMRRLVLGLACAAVGCGDSQSPPAPAGAGSGGSGGMAAMSGAGKPSSGGDGSMVPERAPPRSPPGSCGLENPAFCEDFETPQPGG